MSESKDFNTSNDITAEACAWMAQLNSGELTPSDELAIREWIQRSPRHAAELKKIANLSKEINVLTEMDGSINDAIAQQHSLAKPSIKRKVWQTPLAAGAMMIFCVLSLVLYNVMPLSPAQPVLMTTTIGEFREVELTDGTLVKMNTNTKLAVSYTKDVRQVRVLSGEALFDVEHNPNRPFVVYADEKYVRAVGTAFSVSLLRDELAVTVVEGKVEFAKLVSPDDSMKATLPKNSKAIAAITDKPVYLEVGQHIEVSSDDPIGTVKTMLESDLKRELSWQHELIDFADTPLEEVIQELSRYSKVKVEILDDELLTMKFGGIFRTTDTKPLFDALQTTYNIDVHYVNDSYVQLRQATNSI